MESETQDKTTRNIWLENEIKTLLEVIRENNINTLFDGKKHKNYEIYGLIHKEMLKRGVSSKNIDQIRNKWKSLKTNYNSAKKSNSVSGASRTECDYYELLNEILGSRPSSSLSGVDSVDLESFEISVDPTISANEVFLASPSQSEGSTEEGMTPKMIKTQKQPKKTETDIFMEQQRLLLQEFFEKQREIEREERKARQEDLKAILASFTSSVKAVMQSPAHSVPYMLGYPPIPQSHWPGSSRDHSHRPSGDDGRNESDDDGGPEEKKFRKN